MTWRNESGTRDFESHLSSEEAAHRLHEGFPDESIAQWHERLGLADESSDRSQ